MQEFCQAQKNKVFYKHQSDKKKQVFVAEVTDELGTFKEFGKGRSKKEAEEQAAEKAIKKLGIENKIV